MHASALPASPGARAIHNARPWDIYTPGPRAHVLASAARAPTRWREAVAPPRPPPRALAPPPPAKRPRRAAPVVATATASRSAGEPPSGVLAGLNVVPYRGAGAADDARPSPSSAGTAIADHQSQPPPADLPFHLWHTDPALMAGCEPCVGPYATSSKQKRVAVLLSGGVDSSVALRLAQAAGHRVEAFYLQIWFEEDFRNTWDSCPWEEDLEYARAVAAGVGGAGAAAGGANSNGNGGAAAATEAAANETTTTTSTATNPAPTPPPPVPLTVVPLTRDYWRRVVSESVSEIRRGRTPNPDVLCNSRVKFGAFCEYLERERPGEFDRVASGHYARLLRAGEGLEEERGAPVVDGAAATTATTTTTALWALRAGASPGEAVLALTPDAVKDQTYFLAALSRAQVASAMFPIAALPKARVRALASSAQLPTSARPDSQGICFLGKVRFPEFVREHLGAWPGLLVAVDEDEEEEEEEEEDDGGGSGRPRRQTRRRRVVGGHEGYWFFTVGQRAGIRLPGGPWYVSRKDPRLNVVEVSRSRPQAQAGEGEGEGEEGAVRAAASSPSSSSSFFCGPINWLSGARPQFADKDDDVGSNNIPPLLVKVRHGPNTHAVAAFEVVGVFGGGGGGGGDDGAAAAASGVGGEPRRQHHSDHELSTAERALAEAELAAMAAADEVAAAAAADADREPSSSASASAAAAASQRAADREPRSSPSSSSSFARVRLAGRDQGLAAGQFAVFYQGGVCLGSAKMLAAR